MAKYASNHPELINALRAAGIDIDNARRVVIDIQSNQPVVVHIEQFGDEKMIDVVRTLAGVEIEQREQ